MKKVQQKNKKMNKFPKNNRIVRKLLNKKRDNKNLKRAFLLEKIAKPKV